MGYNSIQGKVAAGHGFSMYGIILGALAACCGQNLDKFLGELARTWGDATNLMWNTWVIKFQVCWLELAQKLWWFWQQVMRTWTFEHLLCAEEACCILEWFEASTAAVGRASPKNSSWALYWKGITNGWLKKLLEMIYSVNFLSKVAVKVSTIYWHCVK